MEQPRDRIVLALPVLLTLTVALGCARTSITSMVAPEAEGRKYAHILVVFPISDLEWRREAERHFRQSYARDSQQFIPSHEVLFPGREYSSDEITQILEEHSIDAALVVALNETGESTSRTPSQTTARCTVWTSTQGCVQATETTTGGMT